VRCRNREAELRSLHDVLRRHTAIAATPTALRARVGRIHRDMPSPSFWSRRRRALAIPVSAALGLAAGIMLAGPEQRQASAALSRVVYHIASSQNVEAALRNLANHLEASPGVKVVVVAHNEGVDFLLRGARDSRGQPYEALLRRFSDLGVEFRVCGNTLVRRKIDSDSVIPGAVLVPSGIAEISRLQSEEGYAYMRL
jgi:intracellular sulfur oxidation DsrE/DsrF family protein